MKHLRLRLDLATRQTRRTLEKRRRSLLIEVAETEQRPNTPNGSGVYLLLRWREDVKRQRGLFDSFYDQYDELIGLLCAAAQLGIEPRMEDEYQKRRAWFTANYPQRVQRTVKPFLPVGDSDDADADIKTGLWGRRAADSFEALYLPASIAAMLAADGGNLIQRMMHTQEALGAWEEYIARQETALAEALRVH